MNSFLRTSGTKIVNTSGKTVALKGVNLGGWLMMEAYILHAPNFPEHGFKTKFAQQCGPQALKDFERDFRNNFIREDDLKRIAAMGLNCVRVPFNHKLIETQPFRYGRSGLSFLDRTIQWAKKYGIYVILDLHGAPGCQNHDWHSDSFGKAELWTSRNNQNRAYALWEFLADRYNDEPTVAGYDILNEAVLDDNKKLNHFYKNVIKAIRSVDHQHIIFIEGNKWAQDIACLEEFSDDNYALSAHYYIPLEFTFNFIPFMKYPLPKFNKSHMKRFLSTYRALGEKRRVPVFVGEFGVNYREGIYNEHNWLKDVLSCFNELGFSWTYWTYKAIKNAQFPDGLFSYMHTPPWVNRAGPWEGWDTYHRHWPTQRKAMVDSWRTQNFVENKILTKALKDAV